MPLCSTGPALSLLHSAAARPLSSDAAGRRSVNFGQNKTTFHRSRPSSVRAEEQAIFRMQRKNETTLFGTLINIFVPSMANIFHRVLFSVQSSNAHAARCLITASSLTPMMILSKYLLLILFRIRAADFSHMPCE